MISTETAKVDRKYPESSFAFPASQRDRKYRKSPLKGGGEVLSPLARAPINIRTARLPTPSRWALRLRRRPRYSPVARHGVTHRALPEHLEFTHRSHMSNIEPIDHKPKPTKPRVVSRRVRHAIDLLVTGRARTQVDAATQAGLSRERLCRALREDHVQTYLADRTRVSLSQAQAPAAAALLRLLDQARSEFVQKDVAIHLLNLSGHKVDKDRGPLVSLNISPGYIIDLSGTPHNANEFPAMGPAGGVIDVSPTREGDE
jgi:hypothetical protein